VPLPHGPGRGRGYAAEQAGHSAATGAQTKPMPSPAAPQTKQREITNHAPTTREY